MKIYRNYDNEIHKNQMTIDHLQVFCMSNDFIPRQSPFWKDNKVTYSRKFRERMKLISSEDNMFVYKGRSYRNLPHPFDKCQIGNHPYLSFSKKFCHDNMCESINYRAEKLHTLLITLNLHKNIRRKYESTLCWNREFDREIRINNDNYTIPEVVADDVVKTDCMDVDHVWKLARNAIVLIYDVDAFGIDRIGISDVEVTQDYTVPYFSAGLCVRQFRTFLTSKEGIEWKHRRGLIGPSITYDNPIRGDCSILIKNRSYDFKCYAKNLVTVRTEIKIRSRRSFKRLGLPRELSGLPVIREFCGKLYDQIGFEKILREKFKFAPDGSYTYPNTILGRLADLMTNNAYSYVYGKLSYQGWVKYGAFKKYLPPNLLKKLEPVDLGHGKFVRLPNHRPMRYRCKNCKTVYLVGTIKCPECGSMERYPTNKNYGVF